MSRTNQGVQLSIKGVDHTEFKFGSLQLTEVVGGALPTIVATYMAGLEHYNLELTEVELTLTYLDSSNITFTANVDQIDFGKNDVTVYFTVAPRDFYQETKSATFLSLDEAIDKLYWGENIVSDISDSSPIEFNQINCTNDKALYRALSSLKSPSCYSFNLGRLKVTDLNDPKPTIFIKEEDKTNYKVDKEGNSLLKGRVRILPLFTNPVYIVDGESRVNQMSWGDKTIFMNGKMESLVNNLVDNSKFYDRGAHMVRVNFKFLPEFMSGDIISIKLPDLEPTEYLVVERIAIMKEDIEVSALLKPL